MKDRYTMVLDHEERERFIDVFQRQVRDHSNYSLLDAAILTRLKATVPDTPEEID